MGKINLGKGAKAAKTSKTPKYTIHKYKALDEKAFAEEIEVKRKWKKSVLLI